MWTEWRVGDWIAGRWEVQKVLGGSGRSGMGIVYVVYDHDPEWRRHLAAKTFQQKAFARDPSVAYRFEQEALTWIRLDHHPNVTRAYLFGRFDNIPLLLFEYVTGGDLSAWIGSSMLTKNLPQVLRFAMQFCDGMSFLVSKGIKAHRDIKPQNCLISENSTLKITDLGIAKVFDDADIKPISSDKQTITDRLASPALYEGTTLNEFNLFSQYEISSGDGLTRHGAGLGTPCYMAPEQFTDAKHVDIRADVYSFGIMVFEMATGWLPFQATNLRDLQHLHCRCAPPQLTVDSRLNSIVQRCLEKNPSERFRDFEEIKTGLSDIYMALSRLHPSAALPPELPTESELLLKASSMLGLRRNEDALDYSQAALAIQPNNIHGHYSKGTALMRLGRLEEAISSYDRALELNPRYASALIGKALALELTGRLEDALVVAETAVNIEPQNVNAFSAKGSIEDSLGMLEVALTTVETALQLDANFLPALVQKGKLLFSLGRRLDEALLCLEHVLQVNPSDVSWHLRLDCLWRIGRREEVEATVHQLRHSDQRYETALVAHADRLAGLSRFGEALTFVDRVLRLRPSSALAWNAKGRILATQILALGDGDPHSAVTCLEKSIECDPKHSAQSWFWKGVLLLVLGRVDESIACYDQALERDARMAVAWFNKGSALAAKKRHREALACFDHAIEIDPKDSQNWYFKGMNLRGAGRIPEALACFERARQLGHPEAELRLRENPRTLGYE